jgi:PKHD-type hydroxylase
MLLQIPNVLTPEQVAWARERLEQAEWVDGRETAGHQSARTKNNMQVRENSPIGNEVGDVILGALQSSALFLSAALPLKVFPPAFNSYAGGQTFGTHVDGAIRTVPGTPHRVRTDLSATLFLSNPEDYDGGELSIEDTYGVKRVKLPAGHMILYPGTSLHFVEPVTRGERLASFFWIQSLVRDDGQRSILFDLDSSIQQVNQTDPDHPAAVSLAGVYYNLLRRWADT